MIETPNGKKSIRSYTKELIDDFIIDDILSYANKQKHLIANFDCEFYILKNTSKKIFNIFSFSPPYYIIIASQSSDHAYINAGFLMQNVNLYLTSLGLGSCYISGGLPKDINLPELKYDYIAALGFGYTKENLFRSKDDIARLAESKTVYYKTDVPKDIVDIITSARLSPSTSNNQPWRFLVYHNKIHVFAKKVSVININYKMLRMFDIGICIANMFFTAEEYWIATKIEFVDSLLNKPLNKNDYVLSVFLDTNVQNI